MHTRVYHTSFYLNVARAWALAHRDRVAETMRQTYRRHLPEITEHRRHRTGLKLRPLRRTEICPRCGQPFQVAERHQVYCDNRREHRGARINPGPSFCSPFSYI